MPCHCQRIPLVEFPLIFFADYFYLPVYTTCFIFPVLGELGVLGVLSVLGVLGEPAWWAGTGNVSPLGLVPRLPGSCEAAARRQHNTHIGFKCCSIGFRYG